jgi:hypothetical protein
VSETTLGRGVFAHASAYSGTIYGVHGLSSSASGTGVYGYASARYGRNYGVYGRTNSRSGYGVYSQGHMHATGDITADATKSAVVKLDNGERVKLYAEEASESWFVDYGSSRLEDGKAVVEIDPTYVETMNTKMEYHVFLTPRGDCKGLCVTNKRENSDEQGVSRKPAREIQDLKDRAEELEQKAKELQHEASELRK